MTSPFTHFDNSPVTLPVREGFEGSSDEADICIRFLRHLPSVPNSNPVIKTLSAIQFVADIMGYSDAHISKVLVDHGLRAPRKAFPAAYLDHIDASLTRESWQVGAPSEAMNSLINHWQSLGESIIVAAHRTYDMFETEAAA